MTAINQRGAALRASLAFELKRIDWTSAGAHEVEPRTGLQDQQRFPISSAFSTATAY
jgi:hypothetical protein